MASERARDRYTDARGVDRLRPCIVPRCETYVTRRRGICSDHWFLLAPEIRLAIQRASKDGDRAAWLAEVRRAVRLLALGRSGR